MIGVEGTFWTIKNVLLKQLNIFEQPASSVPDCEEPECQYIAEVINENMDPSVQPCDDFYKFACGKAKSSLVPLDYVSKNFRKRMMKQLKKTSTKSEEKWEANIRYDIYRLTCFVVLFLSKRFGIFFLFSHLILGLSLKVA